jgi:hypothetical protein
MSLRLSKAVEYFFSTDFFAVFWGTKPDVGETEDLGFACTKLA